MYSSVATPVATAPEAAAQMSQVYTVAKIHVIYNMKLIMANPSPVRQNYRKNNYRKKQIIIETPKHFCDHRGHRFFPVTCLLRGTFFFYNSVGDFSRVLNVITNNLLGCPWNLVTT